MSDPRITEEMIDAEVARQNYVEQGGYAPPPGVVVHKVELTRSIGTVAAGVFFGNSVTAFVAWLIWMIVQAAS